MKTFFQWLEEAKMVKKVKMPEYLTHKKQMTSVKLQIPTVL